MIGMLGYIWMSVWLTLYEKPEAQPRLSAAELAYIRSDSAPAPLAAPQAPIAIGCGGMAGAVLAGAWTHTPGSWALADAPCTQRASY